MIKAAIFDLDSTLINTQEIKNNIFNLIREISGAEDERAMQIYNKVRNKGGEITFSLESLKTGLKASVENFDNKIWEEFESRFNTLDKGLLIDGAEELLNFLKENSVPVYILTLGVEAWQGQKMKVSGLEGVLGGEFKNVKYTVEEDPKKGKIKEIMEILLELNLENCANVLLFNDRPDETEDIMKEFPGLRVFIRREKGDIRHIDKDFDNLAKNKNVIKISDDLNFIDEIKKLV
ncbi:MAG: HAD family hydrolase [bacterium]|nr:HAD family hydrolase [bacterium]